MARATELALQFGRGTITMAAVLNGTPARLVLDTGAQETVVTNDAAHRLALSLVPAGFAYGIGGVQGRYSFVAKTFQIGTLRGRRFDLAATDVHISDGPTPIDGLLGVDFLGAYDVDLDLPDHKAILFARIEGCTSPSAFLAAPLYAVPMAETGNAYDHRAMVHVQIGGHTLTALIDSGAAHTVIFRKAARRLGLNLEDLLTDRRLRLSGVGPQSPIALRHVMTPIEIGDLTIGNLPVAIVDQRSYDAADMLLGLDFLTRIHVWYGFSSRTLIMQYPPQPSPS